VRLLVLGGTQFLGRAVVEDALTRGHEVTLFNRGRTNPMLFPEVERCVGDRDGGLTVLEGRAWGAVIDTSGFVPRVVRQSVELVSAPFYLFVSTRSVHSDFSKPIDENSPVHGDVDSEDVDRHYGELKAMCERVVQDRPGGAIVRPGLIVGPHDPTGRYTYWPHRIARGGEVLAPEEPSAPVTLIDVRDLAEWLVRLCEQRTEGIFEAVNVLSWGEMLDGCIRAAESDAQLVWVPSQWLLEHGVGEWMELPLWIASPGFEGAHRVDNSRAAEAGLTFRSAGETARATLELAETTSDAGMSAERESELLSAWRVESSRLR
jgi:2'-hydroxyisoflavone reductase